MKRSTNKCTRAVAILVVASVAIMSLAVTSEAQAQSLATASLQAVPSSVAPGGSSNVSLSLDLAGVDYTSGVYSVAYDPSVLTIQTCTIVSGGGACNEMQNPALVGQFVFALPDGGNAFGGGTIAQINFDVDANATPGSSTLLDLEVIDFFDDEVDVGASAVDATIEISQPEPEPEPEPKPYERYRRFLRWLKRFLSRWAHRNHGWR